MALGLIAVRGVDFCGFWDGGRFCGSQQTMFFCALVMGGFVGDVHPALFFCLFLSGCGWGWGWGVRVRVILQTAFSSSRSRAHEA